MLPVISAPHGLCQPHGGAAACKSDGTSYWEGLQGDASASKAAGSKAMLLSPLTCLQSGSQLPRGWKARFPRRRELLLRRLMRAMRAAWTVLMTLKTSWYVPPYKSWPEFGERLIS